ncbi:Serine/threonine-protein kinase RIO2 [Fukomys damarensis]|uniref:Serine/threonine-protein kinase RIO2 n=1 Tax=Fukomys damarensis TaxID=885580 RepID=A0A091DM92_FUKDA|nr:Serine/threonine-protein kinase RIO2 [Fukomys damarensis]
MQADDELLHPVGPDDKITETEEGSDFSFSDDEVSEKARSEVEHKQNAVNESRGCYSSSYGDREQTEGDRLSEESAQAHNFETTKFSQPLEEIKGQIVENSCTTEFFEENKNENDTMQEGQTAEGGSPAGSEEEEDDYSRLINLLSLNKEFRPFRHEENMGNIDPYKNKNSEYYFRSQCYKLFNDSFRISKTEGEMSVNKKISCQTSTTERRSKYIY